MSHARAERREAPPQGKRSFGQTLTLVLVGILLFVPSFAFAALQGWVPAPVVNAVARVFVGRQEGAVPWTSGQPVNVLILGLQIGGASTSPLTDSIMVASYQPQTDSVSLLSVPRDLWVEIPGHGEGRINEAFQDGGPAEAMLTVQKNLGIPVNYYAIVNYKAVETLIDHAGGVVVDVPQEIDDPTFPAEDEIHYEPFHITQGVHRLDGREALRYARTRHGDTDFGRADRQQQVLLGLKSQLLKPTNWIKAPLFLHDARTLVKTNFPLDQAPGLMLKVLRAEKDSLHRTVLSYENKAVQPYTGPGGASVLLANQPVVSQIVDDLFGPSLSLLRNAPTIRVENGNGYSGAATQFSQVLTGMGAKVLEPGDADRTDYATHRVLYSGDDKSTVQTARLIAGMLGTTAQEASTNGAADIRVALGRNYAPFVEFTAEDWKAFIPEE